MPRFRSIASLLILRIMLLAMACIVFANVVLRYTTGDSIVWAEEVARHMMIWVTFLGAGLVLRFGGHVAIDNLHRSVGTRKAQWLRRLVVLGVGLFFAVSAGYVLSRPAPRLEPNPVVEVDDANDPRSARRRAATPDADGKRDDAAC